MARAGRKRKEGVARRPDGQVKRGASEALRRLAMLSQPHRRGSANPTDQKLESVFGRFCLRNKLREEIYTAGNLYGDKVRRLRSVKGVPSSLRLSGQGNGGDPEIETVRGWEEEIDRIRADVVRDCRDAGAGLSALRGMILDELPRPRQFDPFIVQAAYWLAVSMKCLSEKEQPF